MTGNPKNHPVSRMRVNAQNLRERAMFAAKTAKSHAARTRKTSSDIASLDIEGIFASLHKMVEMVGGKSCHAHAETAPSTAPSNVVR